MKITRPRSIWRCISIQYGIIILIHFQFNFGSSRSILSPTEGNLSSLDLRSSASFGSMRNNSGASYAKGVSDAYGGSGSSKRKDSPKLGSAAARKLQWCGCEDGEGMGLRESWSNAVARKLKWTRPGECDSGRLRGEVWDNVGATLIPSVRMQCVCILFWDAELRGVKETRNLSETSKR